MTPLEEAVTDSEREELLHDVANYHLKKTSEAGRWAFAVDRVCEMFQNKTDEELLAMLPKPKKTRKVKTYYGESQQAIQTLWIICCSCVTM